MQAVLETAYADTRPSALSFGLDLPPMKPLAALALTRCGVHVELRLLGASHQVIAGPVIETVACLPGREGPLPERAARIIDGWSYEFSARVQRHSGEEFETMIEDLKRRLRGHDDALVGAFPGSPYAVTALVLDAPARESAGAADREIPEAPEAPEASEASEALAWRTWHAYPQTCEVVVTHGRMSRPDGTVGAVNNA